MLWQNELTWHFQISPPSSGFRQKRKMLFLFEIVCWEQKNIFILHKNVVWTIYWLQIQQKSLMCFAKIKVSILQMQRNEKKTSGENFFETNSFHSWIIKLMGKNFCREFIVICNRENMEMEIVVLYQGWFQGYKYSSPGAMFFHFRTSKPEHKRMNWYCRKIKPIQITEILYYSL